MELANTVIKDILQEILVQASEQQVEAVDSQTTIRYMNRWAAEMDVMGISLGYTKITNPTDPVTIPDGALNGLIFNVALRLATSYDIPVQPTLAESANNGLKALRKIAVQIKPSRNPSTLPIGAGNENDAQDFNNFHFFPENPDVIAGEIGGSIQLESETNNGS